MMDDTGAILDDILCRWHRWQHASGRTRGFTGGGNMTGQYQTPHSYLDEVDADQDTDVKVERNIMRQVDFEVRQLPDPWRSAIYALARALSVGVTVFRSPRLPADPAARKLIVSEARARLTTRLASSGVI